MPRHYSKRYSSIHHPMVLKQREEIIRLQVPIHTTQLKWKMVQYIGTLTVFQQSLDAESEAFLRVTVRGRTCWNTILYHPRRVGGTRMLYVSMNIVRKIATIMG